MSINVLNNFSDSISALDLSEDDRATRGVAKAQGVEEIAKMTNLTEEGLEVVLDGDSACNKDTGIKAR